MQSGLKTIHDDQRIKKLNSPSLSKRRLKVELITICNFLCKIFTLAALTLAQRDTMSFVVHKLKWDKFRGAKGHVFFTYRVTNNKHRLLKHVEISLSFDVLKSTLDIFVENMPTLHAKPQACPSSDCFGLFDQATSELQLERGSMVHPGLKFIILRVHVRIWKFNETASERL